LLFADLIARAAHFFLLASRGFVPPRPAALRLTFIIGFFGRLVAVMHGSFL